MACSLAKSNTQFRHTSSSLCHRQAVTEPPTSGRAALGSDLTFCRLNCLENSSLSNPQVEHDTVNDFQVLALNESLTRAFVPISPHLLRFRITPADATMCARARSATWARSPTASPRSISPSAWQLASSQWSKTTKSSAPFSTTATTRA